MIKSIIDANFDGKKVLVRVDFNVPIDDNFHITDDTRIAESLPTIDKIIDDGGIPILISHLGRPKGEPNTKYSLKPVADYLWNVFGYKVIFASDCVGSPAIEAVKKACLGEVVLLENLRFHKEEEKNDSEFAKQLASLADVYVNDAFGTAHRAHASTYAVALLFNERYAGNLLINEIKYLGNTLLNPMHPFIAVMGGAKISGKIDVIKNLLDKCDSILIGGGMSFTFFKAMGLEIGNSLLEVDKIQLAKELLEMAAQKNVKIILPPDIVVAENFANDTRIQIVDNRSIPASWEGLDIGPNAIQNYSKIIMESKTIVWNGPMGVFEMENFAKGTYGIANAIADATSHGAVSVVGGGDSAAAIQKLDIKDKFTHVSTGGGASLEYLEGKELPGLKALEYKS
jgi:phosphoglycerate kinase